MKRTDGSASFEQTIALTALWRRAGMESVSPSTHLPDVEISSLADDSRSVTPGAFFVAVPGSKVDGHLYIDKATAAGAAAILVERDVQPRDDVPVVRVPDVRLALSYLACAFYGVDGAVGRGMKLVGITGTNGKTTVSWLLRSVLRSARHPAALIGTVEYDLVSKRLPAPLTTPGPIQLCHHLADAAEAGATHAILEVSSHALEQRRTDGLNWSVGVFTNLSGDHLDYHGSMESYARAKRRLFDALAPQATAVVNADDAMTDAVVGDTRASVVRFGMQRSGLGASATIESMSATGTQFLICLAGETIPVHFGLVGEHNVMNALAAAATAHSLGVPSDAIRLGLEGAPQIPGRLESVDTNGSGFSVLVDYAHTDDALRNALRAVRPITNGRVRCVFGCGGDRDRGKRPRMAAAVEDLADVAYVTSDNPRTEDPHAIIRDVLPGFRLLPRDQIRVNADRRRAIELAISEAEPGDTVLIAGKGHEDYQIVGDRVLHFDDVEVAGACLEGAVPIGGGA